eukprot:1528780-Amphidinium_carterae.1
MPSSAPPAPTRTLGSQLLLARATKRELLLTPSYQADFVEGAAPVTDYGFPALALKARKGDPS